MPAGRPTEGLEHIDHLHGSFEAKTRLKLIVLTVTGDLTVVEACERLRIGSSRFHVVRREGLQAAVERLEPKPAGRHRVALHASSASVRALEERAESLESELKLQQARTEVALVAASAVLTRDRGGQSRSG